MKEIRGLAKADRRSISDYLIILLEDHVAEAKKPKSVTLAHQPAPPPGMRPVAPVKAPPPSVIEQVMSDDPDGWEGGQIKK